MYVPFRVLGSSLSCLGVFEGPSFSFFTVSDLRSSFSGSSFSSLPFFLDGRKVQRDNLALISNVSGHSLSNFSCPVLFACI